ncbi:MAG: hypothetical protein K2P94_00810 [Rhodospirillaceae bacterium]|nr:hypothetical protein [Rhodospirillaceae bacterium]
MTIKYKTPEAFADAQRRGTTRTYTVGVDLGQTTDPTAIAVIEREHIPGGTLRGSPPTPSRTAYILRHLERLKLGTPYPAQVAYVGSLLARPPLSNTEGTELIIDKTGVGRAVFDMFAAAGFKPKGCTITGGENETWSMGDYRVAKLQLVSRLQAMLHSGELEIAGDLPDLPALKAELQNFRVNFTQVGNMTFAARMGTHDDLVLAVAIALWYAEHRANHVSGGSLQWMPDT